MSLVKKNRIRKTLHFNHLVIALVLLFNFLQAGDSTAIEEKFPQPTGAVNDFASVISPDAKTGTAVVVATFKTIGDNEPDIVRQQAL